MSFLYPSVFWLGLPAIALPLVIHLLNLRRQRRVPWAAMQFLLESQERSKTWVSLQELLLLLLRTAAIAVLVVMLAHPTSRSGWIGRLLNRPVHHLIVLDDSYSMTDRWAETSAWREGLGAVKNIVQAASDQSTASVVSVLRFSEAGTNADDPRPAVFRRPLDSESRQELLSRIETLQPTDHATGLLPALRRAGELADLEPPDRDLVVHVISDFRQRTLNEVDEIQSLVKQLTGEAEELQFVRVVRQSHDNLAITTLKPESGVRAAGVEMWMQVAVENYGAQAANEVVVEFEQDGSPLVAVPLGDIPAGETANRRFRVAFSDPGPHWLAGEIDADAVMLDNRRVYATELPEAQKILLVDGSPRQWESYYVGTALAPGGAAKSGWQPVVIAPADLSNIGSLDEFAAVALLDVPRFSGDDHRRLAAYVEAGGGLFVSVGESIDREFYASEGFAAGEGLLPAPPELPTQWLNQRDDSPTGSTDLQVSDHPVFRVFRGERNSMLGMMSVNYYYSLSDAWRAERSPDTSVIASLADRSPLVVEKAFGRGKVIMQLTKVSPDQGELGSWSNWGPNPAFVVLVNELFGYLAHGSAADALMEVGQPVSYVLDRAKYAVSGSIGRVGSGTPYQASFDADPAAEQLKLVSPPIARSGLYAVNLDQVGGGVEKRLVAINPEAGEGDLRLTADSTLRQKFDSEQFALRYADELSTEANPSESTWSELLLATLLVTLIAEQALAYVCSFHE